MISAEFRLKFYQDLGDKYRYTGNVKARLEAAEVFNSKGQPYKSQSIRNVFNGSAENDDIELAIRQVYEDQKTRNIRLENLRKKQKVTTNKQNPNQIYLDDEADKATD